jgi:methylglyoxal synthase
MGDDAYTLALRKRLALIAHDNEKPNLLAWCAANRDVLAEQELERQRIGRESGLQRLRQSMSLAVSNKTIAKASCAAR